MRNSVRDLAALAVPLAGALREPPADPWEPYRLVDADGERWRRSRSIFRDLQAAGRSAATLRSYGLDLLRWFRFLWAVEVPWDRATRVEARDFCRWMLVAGKPVRPHWRRSAQAGEVARRAGSRTRRRCGRTARRCCAASTTSTWRRAPGRSSTRSRWTARGAAGGRTRTTTRWSRSATSGAGCTGRRCRPGFRAASRTRSSTRSSPGCRRTGTGRWSRSTSRPGPGPRSCCRPRWRASIPDGS